MPSSAPGRVATSWPGVAYGIALGYLAAYLQFKVPPVLPVLFDSYDYGAFVGGGLMSIFALAGLLFAVPVGHAIQRRGAVPFLAGAFALLAAGSALGLVRPENGATMLVARGLEGLGAVVLAVCMTAFANMNAGPRHLHIVVGIQATWIPVGQVVSNAVATPFVADGIWQPVWWAGLAGIAALALWTVAIVVQGRVDLGLRSGRRAGGAAAVADATLTRAEWRALLAAATLFCLWQVQFMAYFTWLPEYLVGARGYGNEAAVLTSQLPAAVLLVMTFATGFVLRAGIAAPRLLLVGLAAQAVGWLLALAGDSPAWGLASLVVWGFAAGVTPTCLWALPSYLLGGQRVGTLASGVVQSGRYLGIIVGPLLAPAVREVSTGWETTILVFGLGTAAVVPWAAAFARRARRLRDAG
ncbi:MAG: MFS transporter [Alphaproteobacteria bacterium]|nr:MFS transporter [Alphaproteobacteria bacterium]